MSGLKSLFTRFSTYLLDTSIRRKLVLALVFVASLPLTITGGFSLWYALQTSQRDSQATISDKLDLAQMMWEVRSQELFSAAQTMAHENLVLINLELGLRQALDELALQNVNRHKTDFAFIVNLDGKIAASSDEYLANNLQNLVPKSLLNLLIGEGSGSFFLNANDAEPLKAGDAPLIFVAFEQIRTSNGSTLAWAVLGTRIGQNHRTEPVFDRINKKIGTPLVILLNDKPVLTIGIELEHLPLVVASKNFINQAQDISLKNTRYRSQIANINDNKTDLVGLGILYPQTLIESARNNLLLVYALVIILAGGIAVYIAFVLSDTISTPIISVAEAAKSIIMGDLSIRIAVSSRDETGLLAQEFNHMSQKILALLEERDNEISERKTAELTVRTLNLELEDRVNARTKELSAMNDALADSISALQKTQKQLVDSEKMVSLATLVTGIAHELNTPLGICLTASTYLTSQRENLAYQLNKGQISKQKFDEFLSSVEQIASLLESNLKRSADLIQIFKQVSPETNGEHLQRSSVLVLIEETLQLYSDELKAKLINTNLQISDNLYLYTYPESFIQTLGVLIKNVLTHAFKDTETKSKEKNLSIRVEHLENNLIIDFQDSGKGITKSLQNQIFEPFFTTARGQGHVGLGLSIAWNVINVRFRGSIEYRESPEGGAWFRLVLPSNLGS